METFPANIAFVKARAKRLLRGIAAMALVLAAFLAAGERASAGSLYVPNYSFESQVTPFADPRVDDWAKAPQPDTFDTNIFGAWDNLAGVFANTPSTNFDHIANAVGNQLAYLFAYPEMAIYQDYNSTDWTEQPPTHAFNAVYTPGKVYHLTVALTSSSDEPLTPGSTLELSLYYRDISNNIVTVAATDVTYDTNVFADLTHLIDFEVDTPPVQTNDAWAGKNIGIQILSTVEPELIGGTWDLDNVRLTESIYVPNFSFESQVTPFAEPRVDDWEKAPQPDTFDTNIFGAWDDLAGVFANVAPTNFGYIDNADGAQLAYLFSYPQMALFQDFDSTDWTQQPPTHAFNAVYTPGKSYTLTVGVTSSSDEPLTQGSTLQLSLYYRDAASNIVTVASTTATFDTNVFTNITHLIDFQAAIPVVNATDPWAGQHIGIQFLSTVPPELLGGVWDLDNVRLNESTAIALGNPAQTNGQFSFTIASEPNAALEILAATNIAQAGATWTSLGTVTNVTGTVTFTDAATNLSARFYRARPVP